MQKIIIAWAMQVALLPAFSSAVFADDAILPEVKVQGAQTTVDRYQLPVTTESVTSEQIEETTNAINTEDALKYLPSLIVRKRNYGDQQAPLATRTSGLGQSARSLIYADGVLLSSLIGNNNTSASPLWSLVAPEAIERIDVMYGPYSAAYAGNSMGAVVEITTRMPQKFEASAEVQGALQDSNLYGTHDHDASGQAGISLGSRTGNFSWWLGANHLVSNTQPLTVVTVARPNSPSAAGMPVTGAYMDSNRTGAPIAVIGAGGLERKHQDTFDLKLAYDFTPQWRATYTLGYFQNDADAKVETYLRDGADNPVYVGSVNIDGYNYNIPTTSFSSTSGYYDIDQEHLAQSLSLKSDTQGNWDWEAVVSNVRFLEDTTRAPSTALPAGESGGAGTLQSLNGTGWYTLDVKGIWRPAGIAGAHQLSFGAHDDRYTLQNSTYRTADWISGGGIATNVLAQGKTDTGALWIQEAWQFAPQFRLTVGGREEHWRALDGRNFSATPSSNVVQPSLASSKFSPKAALAYEPALAWRFTASYGTAYRFPTVSELYQAVTVSGVIYTPNPNLRPERAHSGELAAEHMFDKGRARVSLFQENLADALISQNATIPGTTIVGASTQNIDRIRSRGVEFVADGNDVLIRGLDLSGSVTWVDSKILSDSNFRNATGILTNVSGKRAPNIPRWKAEAVATYHVNTHWSGTLAARYSARVWSTIDNTDINSDTWQGFESYFVMDARARYVVDKHWSAAFGVDNLNNRKYYLFHPFPQRTYIAELKFNY